MSKSDPVLLIIEDDPAIRRFLRSSLSNERFTVFEAENGRQGIIEAEVRKVDVLILDLGLPDIDGASVIRSIRAWSPMPIIVLSARTQEAEKIAALDQGADDYLTKPFGFGELLARIRVALRRSYAQQNGDVLQQLFANDRFKIDFSTRTVWVEDAEIHLTPIQYRLLSILIKHADRVLTHQQILREVWGPSYQENAHYLRIYMSQLRHKLEVNPAQPRYLMTESGIGYRFKSQ